MRLLHVYDNIARSLWPEGFTLVGAMYTNGKRGDPDFAGLQEFEDEDQLLYLAL